MAKQTMPEDDFIATRAGKYRTSRYPGFSGGRTNIETGNIIQAPPSSDPQAGLGPSKTTLGADVAKTPLSNVTSAGIDVPKPPDLLGGAAKLATQGAATWAGGTAGAEAGAALAEGASLGDALSQGAGVVSDRVSGFFGGGGSEGAAAAAGTLLNAPVAANPTKWIPINDNGTTRYIPAW